MDINYSRLLTIPSAEYNTNQVYYIKPKFPNDTVTYYVDCRNILPGIKSVDVVGQGLSITGIYFDGTFTSTGVLSSQTSGTIFSFTASGGADNTTYPITAVVTDINGDQFTILMNLYVSSSQLISSNPPMVLGPQGPQGIQGIQGEQGPQGEIGPQGLPGTKGISLSEFIVTNGLDISAVYSDGSTQQVKTNLTVDSTGSVYFSGSASQLPTDLDIDGNVYIATSDYINGTKKLPSGLSINGNVIMTDGTVNYMNTINNVGILVYYGE